MRLAKEHISLDAVAELNDMIQIRLQKRNSNEISIYIDVNGITVFRIGKVNPKQVEVSHE